MTSGDECGAWPDASTVASQIVDRAESDLAFVPRLMGGSLHLVFIHFVVFIERELATKGVKYGDHPLLRPFIETHARELTDFVLTGIGLRHQIGIQAMERLAGDPSRLLRVDLWDSSRDLIEDAQGRFLRDAGGLRAIIREVESLHVERQGGPWNE